MHPVEFFAWFLMSGLLARHGEAATTTVTTIDTSVTTTTTEVTTTTTEVTTTTPEFLEDIDPPPPLPCFFIGGENVTLNQTSVIAERCWELHFMHKYTPTTDPAMLVLDPRRCGVRSLDDVDEEEICYSNADDGVVRNLIHHVRIPGHHWHSDYSSLSRKKFKDLKRSLENNLMTSLLSVSGLLEKDFERINILSFSEYEEVSTRKKRHGDRVKRASVGVAAEMMVQFGPAGSDLTLDEYLTLWEEATEVDVQTISTEDVGSCLGISSLQDLVPDYLWEASVDDFQDLDAEVPVGGAVHFKCPEDQKPSEDHDLVAEGDNKFSIMCMQNQEYWIPDSFPDCVDTCWMRLPRVPADTGLEPVVPQNTIPVGSFGMYVCSDATLGVESGPSPFFKVKCLVSKKYDVPKPPDTLWPVSILEAVFDTLAREDRNLELLHKRYIWKEGEEGFVAIEGEDWFALVTLPVLGLMIAFLACCCYCTHVRSICCMICAEQSSPKKIIRPYIENHDQDKSSLT